MSRGTVNKIGPNDLVLSKTNFPDNFQHSFGSNTPIESKKIIRNSLTDVNRSRSNIPIWNASVRVQDNWLSPRNEKNNYIIE